MLEYSVPSTRQARHSSCRMPSRIVILIEVIIDDNLETSCLEERLIALTYIIFRWWLPVV